ncbi:post-transcriptional regulator [Granulicatella sp. 19428wC4_WM01]|uniref:post-transcriptional regulator n=1 Tax=Granulicatella sp. 19428wC4_WM01 TaxID=2782471 RepID=UPI001883EAEB|nr:post-transcriptional regulator [Granulicatella sp. 19428wC4_WM01]MBF0780968.1 post-transcriptional regulator [Granulicatella sp. 19428wC4_WM01]
MDKWIALKVDDFHQKGYSYVCEQDICEYLYHFLWRRQKPEYYVEQVNSIIRITPNHFFDYKTLQIQVTPIQSLDDLDFSELI